MQEGVAAVDHSVVAADLDERTAPSLRSCGPTLGMLTDAGADWHRPKRLLDEGSNVHMRVIDEIRGVLFSSDLVRWASCLGINVINHTAGGQQRGATECGIIAVFSCVSLVAAGEAWRDVDVSASASEAELDWAAARAGQWAAKETHENVLRRYLGEEELRRLVGVVAGERSVRRLTGGAVSIQTLSERPVSVAGCARRRPRGTCGTVLHREQPGRRQTRTALHRGGVLRASQAAQQMDG